MSLTFVGKMNIPTYTALSTDISANKISGASIVGGTIFVIDTASWYIIKSDLTLGTYTVGSVSSTISGALPAGTNSIGSVTAVPQRSLVAQPTMSITMTVAATYVTGDYIGVSGVPITFPSCSAVAGSGGYIMGATLIDYAKQSVAGELWLFDTTVTPPADSAAWTLSDADMAKVICVIPFSTYYASALNSVSRGQPDGGPARFVCGAAVQTLFGCFVTRGAPAYATGDLTVRLSIVQD